MAYYKKRSEKVRKAKKKKKARRATAKSYQAQEIVGKSGGY